MAADWLGLKREIDRSRLRMEGERGERKGRKVTCGNQELVAGQEKADEIKGRSLDVIG